MFASDTFSFNLWSLLEKEKLNGLSAADRRAYEKRCDDALNVSCLVLATMSHNLQK
jgi:hypothetical protein